MCLRRNRKSIFKILLLRAGMWFFFPPGGYSAMFNDNNWKFSCLNYWNQWTVVQLFLLYHSWSWVSAYLAQTLFCSSYDVYKMSICLYILFPGREYKNDLRTQHHRIGSLHHNEASSLNFQYSRESYLSLLHIGFLK